MRQVLLLKSVAPVAVLPKAYASEARNESKSRNRKFLKVIVYIIKIGIMGDSLICDLN